MMLHKMKGLSFSSEVFLLYYPRFRFVSEDEISFYGHVLIEHICNSLTADHNTDHYVHEFFNNPHPRVDHDTDTSLIL